MNFTHPFDATTTTQSRAQKFQFPVGYHYLHPDVSLNFQMNRCFNWVGDATMLNEMRSVTPFIDSVADFTREFMTLAERALGVREWLKAAFYLRAAEFFMLPGNPAKHPTRERFLQLVKTHYDVQETDHARIPYEGGALSAYRFTTASPKGIIVVFGGFDSYIEECFAFLFALRDAGYEVTLLGLSLGGGLVVRTAAYETRVRRIIADDVLTNFSEVVLRQVNGLTRLLLKSLVTIRAARAINTLMKRAAKRSPVIEWGLQQGLHVTGSRTPYEFLLKIRSYSTAAVSPRVTQDALLFAAARDHYVPLHQFQDQVTSLRNARSITKRMFSRAEHADNHCQVGNLGLSLKVIVTWLDAMATNTGKALQ